MRIVRSYAVKADCTSLTKRIPVLNSARDKKSEIVNLKSKIGIWLVLPVLTYQKTKEEKSVLLIFLE